MPWASARRRSNSARRRGSSLRGQSRDWTHPEGFKLSEVQENAEYEGVVTNVSRRAVFVDFGAERDGILFVPKGVSLRNFKEGTQVKGLQVVSVDLVRDRATLEADLSKVATHRRPRDEFFHEDGCPLEELRENQAISGGQVTFSNSQVIYVDFGAVRDGKLLLPRHLRGEFKVGDEVEGLRVQRVNLEKDEVLLVADNPEEEWEKVMAGRVPIDDYRVGDTVEGFVTNSNRAGVFINIGAERDARLNASYKAIRLMRTGMFIEDLQIVSIDAEKKFIRLEQTEGRLADESNDNEGEIDQQMAASLARNGRAPPQEAFARGRPQAQKALPVRPAPKQTTAVAARKPARTESAPPMKDRSDVGASPSRSMAPKPKGKASPAPRAGPTPVASQGSGVRSASARKAPVDPARDDVKAALETIQAGDDVNGFVMQVKDSGIIVHLSIGGTTVPGTLAVDNFLRGQFMVGDLVQGMLVEEVDMRRRTVRLSMESPELSVESGGDEAHGPEKPLALENTAMPKAKSKAKPKPVESDPRLAGLGVRPRLPRRP